jgi:hypothetical protein
MDYAMVHLVILEVRIMEKEADKDIYGSYHSQVATINHSAINPG